MDTFVHHFGLTTIVIDPDSHLHRDQMPSAFDSLEQAQAAHPDHTWVWMCANGSVLLEEFKHPTGDSVVYAFGHNVDGMGPEFDDQAGSKVSVGKEKYWDYIIAPQVLYDRKMYLAGRRR
jgi:hypothetical protein